MSSYRAPYWDLGVHTNPSPCLDQLKRFCEPMDVNAMTIGKTIWWHLGGGWYSKNINLLADV